MRRLQAIAQNGLHYSENPFERERFEEVRQMAAGGDGPLEELVETFAAASGHACPKIDVRAVAFRADEILLVRGRDDGLWTPPGGWAEIGESPRAVAEKELREESGYAGRVTKLVGIWEVDLRDRPRWPFYGWKLVFVCDLLGDPPAEPQAAEVTEVGFFAPDDLPPLSGRIRPEQIAAAREHRRDPSLASYVA